MKNRISILHRPLRQCRTVGTQKHESGILEGGMGHGLRPLLREGHRPYSQDVGRAVELFAIFKADGEFHPSWGSDRAQATLEQCNK